MEAHSVITDSQLADVLLDTLAHQPGRKIYSLIDGSAQHEALNQFFQLAPDAEYHPLFLGTEYEDCLPHSPYVTQITKRHVDFIKASNNKGGPIWFTSPFSLEQQLEFWKSRLFVVTPDGNQPLFRFWNAAILEPYVAAIPQLQVCNFLCPVESVIIPLTEKRDWHVRRLQSASETHTRINCWSLSEAELEIFEESFTRLHLREIESALWTAVPELMTQRHPATIPNLIESGLLQARRLGLSKDKNLTRFIESRLRWGENFWQHEQFAEIWGKPTTGALFIDMLTQILARE